MRSWPETYAKDVLGSILELRGRVIMEHEIVERRLRADMLFVPEPDRRGREDLGIVERMTELGPCVIELFSRPPRAQAGFDCVGKHLAHHRVLCNQAQRKGEAAPPRPRLWMISPGRPRSLIAEMAMQPMDGWPPGFWRLAGAFHVHLVVVRDLPEVRETLLLRLLGNGKRLQRAHAEVDRLPLNSRLRQSLETLMVAWREEIFETSREEEMLSPESKARYAAWEKRVRGEGRLEGIKEGRLEGERMLLRKQLALRFGELPAEVERRIECASLAELELWAERVLTAGSLAAVFTD